MVSADGDAGGGERNDSAITHFDGKTLTDYYYQLCAARGAGQFAVGAVLGLRAWRMPVLERLTEVRMPVTLIWGTEDMLTLPENGKLALELLPHSELHLITGAGHAPNREAPDEFRRAVIGEP